MISIGIGYDVHPLTVGRKLMLGGIQVPFAKGLDGHSDADVLIHALCDAIFGAIGERDSGHFFPGGDPRFRNAASINFIKEASQQVSLRHGRIINLDSVIIASAPDLRQYIHKMRHSLANAVGLVVKNVNIKIADNDNMGFIGRGEAMAAMAVACVELSD